MSTYEINEKEDIKLKLDIMPYLEAYILSDGIEPDDVVNLKFIVDDICRDEVMVVIKYTDDRQSVFSLPKKQLFTDDYLEEKVRYGRAIRPEKREYVL